MPSRERDERDKVRVTVRRLDSPWWVEANKAQATCPDWWSMLRLRVRTVLVDRNFTGVVLAGDRALALRAWARALPGWDEVDPPIAFTALLFAGAEHGDL